jgi:hypothetical protein
VVAIESAMYREVLARALRRHRPDAEVGECDPAVLDREVTRARPDVAFCPEATDAVRAVVGCWVEIPFADATLDATVGAGGRVRCRIEGVELSDLLGVVDGAVPRREEDFRG